MIAARLKGLISAVPPSAKFVRQGDPAPAPDPSDLPIEIGDARVLQAGAESAAALFAARGFALLGHRAEDSDAEIEARVLASLFAGRRIEISTLR